MHESEVLYAVVQFDGTAQRTVRRVVAPFPDRSSAALFAVDNDLRNYTVGPMSFAVPTRAVPVCHGVPTPRAGGS
ncbi:MULTISPECIES: hypothetical protein [unclassified Frankia]|uniref:hypothetical protein n=1 Tax=unclassified Frankia TaxID=2632575 RepID=UPI00202492C5